MTQPSERAVAKKPPDVTGIIKKHSLHRAGRRKKCPDCIRTEIQTPWGPRKIITLCPDHQTLSEVRKLRKDLRDTARMRRTWAWEQNSTQERVAGKGELGEGTFLPDPEHQSEPVEVVDKTTGLVEEPEPTAVAVDKVYS